MRSPRSVCSKGSSHTAHSVPTNVRSLRDPVLSMSSTPAIPLPDRGTDGGGARVGFADCRDDDRESTGVDAENGFVGVNARRGEYGDLGIPGESIRSR
jgi:hypothetical protein